MAWNIGIIQDDGWDIGIDQTNTPKIHIPVNRQHIRRMHLAQ